ncbi:MAG: ABC transporter ATP-binding protein [Caldilineaceae bacterium SB0670_bin_27]|uniref:ABC transporter ATP-binding protein n=1 Tax=Caldilineaceae bacterium SB0664_bin_27 TaxID=2605260 RepID=A0A6B0YQ76_9CHLR|nr:ABC transporter ATP-binding protein [Caldilineaceae bacterium SB0664_bin_27]MYJ79057.1 ABC transporter ATP-binding protein [Caldilineaceae bacterium SB0670_bin_27]
MLRQETLKPKSVGATLSRFSRYFRPFWLGLTLVAVLMAVNAYTQVIGPVLIGQAVDCFLAPSAFGEEGGGLQLPADTDLQAETDSQANCWYAPEVAMGDPSRNDLLRGLLNITLIITAYYLVGSVTGGLMFFSMSRTGHHVLRRLRVRLFNHLHRLSLGFYTRNETGDLMSRITNDSDTIQQVVSFALVQVLSSVLLILWIVWQMVVMNWAYALISLSVVPLMGLATLWFSNQARKAFRVTRQSIGDVNAELEEGISGVREVQAFSREETNIEQFRQSNAVNRDANIKAVAYTSALAPTLEALGFLGIAVVVGVGGILLLRGQTLAGSAISLGLIVTFLGFAQRFNMPISQISVMWTNIQSAIAGVERIFELMDEVPEVQEKVNARPMPPIEGNVALENVEAEYVPGEPVLKGINLSARPGETVAIVGPTGAGKTTIINLLPRFWDVTGGTVRIDGVDVRDVQLHSLREQIGIVLQDTYLFSSSVMDNIRFSRSDASDEEVIAAAKLAQAHDFIERLPEGYETVLGERGAGLSQGQRQLLAIARSALADPRILILDEATSSVDTRTEQRIQAALNDLLKGRTSFVIAHRLSTIRSADQVLVLHDGEIIERGTHEELLARQGFYYELYMNQFRRQEDLPVQPNGSGPTSVETLPARPVS